MINAARFTSLLAILLLALSSAQAAKASPQSELESKARAGDLAAEMRLVELYEKESYGSPDYAKAAFWLKKAAEQGNPLAQQKLGYLLTLGLGVKADKSQALKWYQKSAEQGNPVAEFNLGLFYSLGQTVPESPTKALTWYRRAAEHGNPNATLNLAALYEDGIGTRRDEVLAFALLLIAYDQGSQLASARLSETERWRRLLSKSDRNQALAIAGNWRTNKNIPATSTRPATPFVTIENGDTLRITGLIKTGAFEDFKRFFSPRIHKIIVNSGGGNGIEGVKIAEMLQDKNITVEVNGQCMSACANYIFLSAKNRIVSEKSIVCFHGGIADNEEDFRAEMTYSATPEREKRDWEIIKSYAIRQDIFLRNKGIDKSLLSSKFNVRVPNYANEESESYKARFGIDELFMWCPNRDDLAKLGVEVDEMWYPSDINDLIDLGKKYSASLIAASKRDS